MLYTIDRLLKKKKKEVKQNLRRRDSIWFALLIKEARGQRGVKAWKQNWKWDFPGSFQTYTYSGNYSMSQGACRQFKNSL